MDRCLSALRAGCFFVARPPRRTPREVDVEPAISNSAGGPFTRCTSSRWTSRPPRDRPTWNRTPVSCRPCADRRQSPHRQRGPHGSAQGLPDEIGVARGCCGGDLDRAIKHLVVVPVDIDVFPVVTLHLLWREGIKHALKSGPGQRSAQIDERLGPVPDGTQKPLARGGIACVDENRDHHRLPVGPDDPPRRDHLASSRHPERGPCDLPGRRERLHPRQVERSSTIASTEARHGVSATAHREAYLVVAQN